MTVLHCMDPFPIGKASVAIEPRLLQPAFPEHHHDLYEIAVVEHETGIHTSSGQPCTTSGGTVCFVRDHDQHLYEHTDNLCLINVLHRSSDVFQFLVGLNQLLPQEQNGQYPPHWWVNQGVLQQARQLVGQMEALGEGTDTPTVANREILFMQLLVLLHKNSLMGTAADSGARLNLLMVWLEDNFVDEACWGALVEKFFLSLRTLHRQLRQQTGPMPQRYLNRLRLVKARYLLRHGDDSVTDIAYLCGFDDSNHLSTLFRREFKWPSRDIRQGCDFVVASRFQ